MRELNESNLDLTMREVRIEETLRKVVENVKTSIMDSSKKVDFMVLAKMMSESNLGRVRLESDNLNIQERVCVTEVSDEPQVGILRRQRDPEKGVREEGFVEMSLEDLSKYVDERIPGTSRDTERQ